jgi:hypothetical protein
LASSKHLTARGKGGRKPGKAFSRAWLVRYLVEEARRRHREEQEARRRDPRRRRRSLPKCGEQAVKGWGFAELTRLAAEHEGQDLADQIAALEARILDLKSSVLTHLRGRGVSKRRRAASSDNAAVIRA